MKTTYGKEKVGRKEVVSFYWKCGIVPAKLQSCANCSGDCCSAVTFMADTGIRLNREQMDFSVNELRELGFQETFKPHKPCVAKTENGCQIYNDRPRLCRSYYCHGRHWKPKGS